MCNYRLVFQIHQDLMETMAYQTDKGTGIKEMIEHFGINQEETLVIGDSDNDRAMFEFGHYSRNEKCTP